MRIWSNSAMICGSATRSDCPHPIRVIVAMPCPTPLPRKKPGQDPPARNQQEFCELSLRLNRCDPFSKCTLGFAKICRWLHYPNAISQSNDGRGIELQRFVRLSFLIYYFSMGKVLTIDEMVVERGKLKSAGRG